MDCTFLWLNLGSHLRCFHNPLLRELSHWMSVMQWNYQQSPDEPATLELPLQLLHEYLQNYDRPVHLAGHGMSGTLGLLYAQRNPQRVQSLTLLGVSSQPGICWQSHYYMNRRLLNCDRSFVLSVMVSQLFGEGVRPITRELVCRLQREIDEAPSPHSLFCDGNIAVDRVPVPLLACGSHDDAVVAPDTLMTWQPLMHPLRGDRIWQCPGGRHFFHYFHPERVSQAIASFVQQLSPDMPSPSPHFCLSQTVADA